DGAVRLSGGMTLRMDNPGVMLVPSENPLETGSINRMLLTGGIGGTSVIVSEDGIVKAFHGGSYLPAVVTANALGLQLGLLARPSGEALTIDVGSLVARGIQDMSLLNVVYPNGETSTVIYTGGSLQIPLLTYSSGAFVGIQRVETRVVWTGIKQDEFYTQIASISEILSGMLGRGFAEELVKTLLQSGLTDSQALDIANELVKSLEWLKSLSPNRRIDSVRRITDYVKKGDTAEEARKKFQKEAEEYVEDLKLRIMSFCQSISDRQLANEVENLLRHIMDTLGPNAAEWLLQLLRNVYYKALAESNNDRDYANAKLRSVVEKVFKYPESKEQGCALASEIVKGLMQIETNPLSPEYLFKDVSVWSGSYIRVDKMVEPGLYWIIAKDGERILAAWSWRTPEGSNLIHVASDKVDALKGKTFDIEIYPYKWELHFPKEFDAYGYHFEIDPWRKILKISKDGETYLIPFNNPSIKELTPRGVALVVKTDLRSTRYGTQLVLEFFERGTGFSIVEGMRVHPIDSLSIHDELIEIHHANQVFKAPLNPKELNYGKIELERPIDLSDLEYGASLVMPLRERFRYEDVEELRNNLEAEKELLRLYWDNGKVTYCAKEILGIKIPGGAKRIVAIERAKITEVEKWVFDIIKTTEEKKLRNLVGQTGEMIVRETPELVDYVLNEVRKSLNLGKEVPLKLLSERFDKNEYYEARKKVTSEDVRPDFLVVREDTGDVVSFVELKSTIQLSQ
ncbi:MAG: hypothetical protein FGF50_11985, partial [Candidatus Brockarchaeota archaeon]|nr:hypothetical protein [Candidatus Brockarchaeota archaeon]